jgi:hypothetical protein
VQKAFLERFGQSKGCRREKFWQHSEKFEQKGLTSENQANKMRLLEVPLCFLFCLH